MESLLSLENAALHDTARQRGRDLASSRWEAAACLLAVERKGIHLEHDCPSVSQYAERFLGIEAYVAAEMLRVARSLESLPELSEGFRTGAISWTSIREITRRAETATDGEWATLGRQRTTGEIQRMCVRSPRAWEREQKLEQQEHAEGPPDLFTARAADESGQADKAPVASASAARAAASTSAVSVPEPMPAALPGGLKPHIGLSLQLTPEVYELYKALAGKVRSSHRGTMTKEQVFEEICHRALHEGGDGKKRRSRTIVVLHFDPQVGSAWAETDRGVVPVASDVIDAALQTGLVVVAPATETDAAAPNDEKAPPPAPTSAPKSEVQPSTSAPLADVEPASDARPGPGKRRRGRRRLSSATLMALYARSNGRCELCGCSSYLHVHHRTPTSRGGTDDLEGLLLLCSRCHGGSHRRDYAENPLWSAARERGRARNKERTTGVLAEAVVT